MSIVMPKVLFHLPLKKCINTSKSEHVKIYCWKKMMQKMNCSVILFFSNFFCSNLTAKFDKTSRNKSKSSPFG